MGTSKVYTLPAPIAGIDKASALNRLDDLSALDIVNFYCDDGILKVRKGLTELFDIGDNPVQSLNEIPSASGEHYLFYASNGVVSVYEEGETTLTTSGYTNDIWQSVFFGYKLFAVNGTDAPFYIDSSTKALTALTFTGVTLTNLINVNTYRERLYFIEKNSGNIWYTSTTRAITGALTKFDADYILRQGGFVVACGGYTNKLSTQIQDLFYILSSEGELILYQGNSPGASDWSIVARFEIGKPLGYQCVKNTLNDTWILTDRGVESINELFSGVTVNSLNTVSAKVNQIIRTYALGTPFSSLWKSIQWTNGSRIFVTLPEADKVSRLLVYNTNTLAWSEYSYTPGADSFGYLTSFSIFNGHPYAGGYSGKVIKLEDGYSDNDESIDFEIKYGHSYFNSALFKRFTAIRPLIKTASNINLSISMLTDYREAAIPAIITTTGSFTPWGSLWGSLWSSPVEPKYSKFGLSGSGTSGALRISGSIKDVPLEIFAFDIYFEDGAQA